MVFVGDKGQLVVMWDEKLSDCQLDHWLLSVVLGGDPDEMLLVTSPQQNISSACSIDNYFD